MANGLNPNQMLRKAVDVAGGQSALARIVGCSQSYISLLLKNGKPLPGQHVLKTEAATGISRSELRPDLYPPDGGVPAACKPKVSPA